RSPRVTCTTGSRIPEISAAARHPDTMTASGSLTTTSAGACPATTSSASTLDPDDDPFDVSRTSALPVSDSPCAGWCTSATVPSAPTPPQKDTGAIENVRPDPEPGCSTLATTAAAGSPAVPLTPAEAPSP